MFKILGIDETKYSIKDYAIASLFFVCAAGVAITLTNLTFFYNMYETNYDFFNLVYMTRHPLSYFAYGVTVWFLGCYLFSIFYKGISGNLLRAIVNLSFWLYLIVTVIMLFYYLAYFNISFQTYTYFDAFTITIQQNIGFVVVNLAMAIFFYFDRKIKISKQGDTQRKELKEKMESSRLSKAKVIASWIIGVLILNEIIVALSTYILNQSYHPFPFSLQVEFSILASNNALAMVVSLITIASAILLILGVIIRQSMMKLLLMIPITFFVGSMLSNIVYYLFTRGDISLSPLYMFSLYFNQQEIMIDNQDYKISLIVGFLVGLIFGVFCVIRAFSSNKNIHGDARFANYFDLIKYKMFKHCDGTLKIGRWNGLNIYSQDFYPLQVIGSVGCGKSTALAIPIIIQWNGSGIHNDMSNELYKKTANGLRSLGYLVYQFCPTSRKTHRFNPFHWCCAMDVADRWGVIERICLKIIPKSKGESSKSWSSMARRVLEGLSGYLISTTGYCTLGQLAEICCKGNFTEWLKKEILENDQADTQFKVNAIAFINIDAAQTQGGVKFNYEAYIGLYLNPIIRASTEFSDFDITRLRKEKMHIFFGIPDGEIDQLEPLIAMFWEELSAHLMTKVPDIKEEPYPVLLNIDEFGNSGRLDRVRKNLTTLRKYRVRTIIYLQYRGQVGQDFTVEESKAFNAIPNKIVLSATGSVDDAKYFSELFGQKTIRYNTKSRQAMRMDGNTNENVGKRALMTQDEFMQVRDNDGLLHVAGKHPIKFKKSYYFKDRKLMELLGEEIDSDTDNNIPTHEPIEPAIDLSMMKKELTDEEKEIKKMENEAKEDRNHKQELDKIREMTSLVLESVDRARNPKNERDDLSSEDV